MSIASSVCTKGWSFLMFYNLIIVLLKHVVDFKELFSKWPISFAYLFIGLGFLLLLGFFCLFHCSGFRLFVCFVCFYFIACFCFICKVQESNSNCVKILHFSKRCVRRVLIHEKENAIWNTKTGKPVILSLFRDGIVDILVLWNLPPIY